MTLVDDKGKLFGLINIIDLLVIIAVIFIGFTGYSLLTKKGPVSVAAQSESITMKMVVQEVRPDQVPFLKKGDILKRQETQNILGTIESVEVRPAELLIESAQGNKVVSQSPRDKDVHLIVKTKGRTGADMIATGNEVLKVGVKFNFVTKWYYGTATILDIQVEN